MTQIFRRKANQIRISKLIVILGTSATAREMLPRRRDVVCSSFFILLVFTALLTWYSSQLCIVSLPNTTVMDLKQGNHCLTLICIVQNVLFNGTHQVINMFVLKVVKTTCFFKLTEMLVCSINS